MKQNYRRKAGAEVGVFEHEGKIVLGDVNTTFMRKTKRNQQPHPNSIPVALVEKWLDEHPSRRIENDEEGIIISSKKKTADININGQG